MSTPDDTNRPTTESWTPKGLPPQDPAMDPQVTTIQPGGGIVMSIELAWGKVRRWYLRTFRAGYVARMRELRKGEQGDLPFEPVDPRDLKYYQNQETYWWKSTDDPFVWRDSFPFVRVGLAELILMGGGFLALAWIGWIVSPILSVPFLVLAGLIAWFFRDPVRSIPPETGSVVAPADGKLVQIEKIDDPELGPCVQIGIFLSIFNVHANRASLPGTVVAIRYHPGKFLNALKPESARENENLDIIIETEDAGSAQEAKNNAADGVRRYRIRQITGQFARRIVCCVRPGDILSRGQMFGMIKLGSRTELIIPDDPSLEIIGKVGQKISAGSTLLARYQSTSSVTLIASEPIISGPEESQL